MEVMAFGKWRTVQMVRLRNNMYSTVESVRSNIKGDAINSIIGDEYIEDDAVRETKILEIIEAAIDDADAEIDGYLAKRHAIPLLEVPKMVEKLSKDIAIYNLFSRRGIDEQDREKNYLTRYNAAISFLKLVASGQTSIGLEEPKKQAVNGFKMSSNERLFTRDSMKGL